jgi:hypothetical protein
LNGFPFGLPWQLANDLLRAKYITAGVTLRLCLDANWENCGILTVETKQENQGKGL